MEGKAPKNLTIAQALSISVPLLVLIFSAWINVQVRLTEHEKSIDALMSATERNEKNVNSQYQLLRAEIKEVNSMLLNVQLQLKDKQDRQ